MANLGKPGIKYDQDKLRWDLLPMDSIEKVVAVLTAGSIKYGDNNWQKVENGSERYFAAAMRHIVADRKGEILDEETGQPHLAHAICCLLFKLWKQDND